jgi:hypothetical protein
VIVEMDAQAALALDGYALALGVSRAELIRRGAEAAGTGDLERLREWRDAALALAATRGRAG